MKEMKIDEFLLRKNNELSNYYRKAPREIQKVMKNIYNASFRFGLNDTQTIYMIEQAIQPLKQDILKGYFDEEII